MRADEGAGTRRVSEPNLIDDSRDEAVPTHDIRWAHGSRVAGCPGRDHGVTVSVS